MRGAFTLFRPLCLLALAAVFCGTPLSAQNSRDFAVLLRAELQQQPRPAIVLHWEADPYAQEYIIERKKTTTTDWMFLVQPSATATSFTDTLIQPGTAYEYQVRKLCTRPVTDDSTLTYQGTGYICAGIGVLPPDQSRRVLLLVDNTMSEPLAAELERMEQDMQAEGWRTLRRTIARTEEFDPAAVQQVRAAIAAEYGAGGLHSVLLLGRVAVPYAGRLAPDGHPDHIGAWPADMYYADISSVLWTDKTVNDDTSAFRPANRNTIGDGKFDQSFLPSSLELSVGRVDFYNLPDFALSETELLRRYLDKNHRYRTGQIAVRPGGIIDDHFSASSYAEAFASCGWRNIALFGGAKGVRSADWMSTLDTAAYLWAYGCGAGSYSSASAVATTLEFTSKPVNAIFTMLFGSYFGDWDTPNNLLRAALASEPSILTCVWAARPQWYFHHMLLGEPIGVSARVSQENSNTYIPNINYNVPGYPDGVAYTIGNRQVHTALLGDPTLRVYNGTPVAAPLALTTQQLSATQMHLTWEAPATPVDGYEVLRSALPGGPFIRVSDTILTTASFTDNTLSGPSPTYMVRAVALRSSNGGTYYEAGPGITQTAVTDVANPGTATVVSVTCTPNPAVQTASLSFHLPAPASVQAEIFDIAGMRIARLFSGTLPAGAHTMEWNLRCDSGTRVAPGLYAVRCSFGTESRTTLLTVLR